LNTQFAKNTFFVTVTARTTPLVSVMRNAAPCWVANANELD
jgi:hypothetical protein